MRRRENSTGSVLTAILAGSLLGAAAVAVPATGILVGLDGRAGGEASAASGHAAPFVNRESKTDALPFAAAHRERIAIKSVEVVGVRDASIVYRDRDGNILFRTDPLANVTVVTKNVDLPEVTIRETEQTEVERVPAETTGPAEPPQGCESAFARPSPEALTRTPSRCLAEAPGAAAPLAALN